MTELTERYLAAALRGIPQGQRADVERELRSSIADAIEDRLNAGAERAGVEKAVLEGLGDPVRLAAGLSGRPLHLIGPDLFVEYRQLLVKLLSITLPIVGIVQTVLAVSGGDDYAGAVVAGIGGAWTVGLHLFFWVTITFALIERVDAMRDAKDEITGAGGRWTVERLPALPPGRVGAGETVGELLTTVLSIGGIVFLNGVAWFRDSDGKVVTLFNPAHWGAWMPVLLGVLVAIAALQIVVFLAGRWTAALASLNAVLQLAFSVPVIVLALTGSLVNPAFADAIRWPPLADGSGPAMLGLAAGVGLVTVWEIVEPFRRARRTPGQPAERATEVGLDVPS